MEAESGNWKVQERADNRVHVFPADEEDRHDLFGVHCPCGTREVEGQKMDVVVHSAFDGREWAERAEEIFNNPDRYLP